MGQRETSTASPSRSNFFFFIQILGKIWFNGLFPKWNRTFTESSEFGESDKSLKHELGSI